MNAMCKKPIRTLIGDLGFFRGGDFGNPSERSERALWGFGLKFEIIIYTRG